MPRKPFKPICPKCGYDQSGEIATWKSQCPINGRCNECGIPFQWADIFDPSRTRLHWYAEHARSLTNFLSATPKTLIRIILPHRFWRTVDTTKDLRPMCLIAWVIFVMILSHLIVSIPNGILARSAYNWNGTTIGQHYQMYGGYGIAEILFVAIAFPYFNALPRASSFRWTLFIETGWPEAWYQSFFKVINFQLGFLVLWLLILAVIPTTRSIAKIRTGHVIRAACLSALWIFLSYELSRALRIMHALTDPIHNLYWFFDGWIVPVSGLWQVLFWSCAVSIGWKVKQWKSLVLLGTAAALLGGTALSIYAFLYAT
ncbi:MAG: hypothetical protein JJ974_03040 [Phycisphaerales bacterium]|nr:hypothetical protein [Phycisphaerales bacterium]